MLTDCQMKRIDWQRHGGKWLISLCRGSETIRQVSNRLPVHMRFKCQKVLVTVVLVQTQGQKTQSSGPSPQSRVPVGITASRQTDPNS